MNFISLSQNNNEQVSRIINANSWSNCLAYLEGTGENILQIYKIEDSTLIVLNSPQSTNCYNILLQDTSSQENYNYIVFENNYNDLNNWISQQTGKTLVSFQLSEKSYVTV